jgi:archaellum biogenesis protein FlaJ (TadC family)
MLVILFSLLGAGLGVLRARKLGGRKMDALHYGVIFALIGALLGVFATIIIQRLA